MLMYSCLSIYIKQVTLLFHLHNHMIQLSQRSMRKTCQFDIYLEGIIFISQISLDEYFVNPGILISMESLPTELNSSGFKDGKDNLDLTICLGYVTNDGFFTCFLNVIILCIIKTKIGKEINKLLAMVLMDNFDALDSENIG